MTFFQGCLSGLSIFEVNGEFASLWIVNFLKAQNFISDYNNQTISNDFKQFQNSN